MDNTASPHSKHFVIKDVKTKKAVVRAGKDATLRTLLDVNNTQFVKLAEKRSVDNIYYVYQSESNPDTDDADYVEPSDESELLQIYVKLGWERHPASKNTILREDFTGRTTGERCKIEMGDGWQSHRAKLWLDHISSGTRSLIATVFKLPRAQAGEYNIDIAQNVDTPLVLTICAVVDEELKREHGRGIKDHLIAFLLQTKANLVVPATPGC
ncbi:hypothetical protein PybrP1_003821 [[Pythium] brassicae (nom. inval.)]|nr:hypothetical protein PybrP1_003821 [[Pythium] brassicae (nom. inval.)]